MSNNKGRVFVSIQPTMWDTRLNRPVPSIDLTPAERFGELIFMLPEGHLAHRDIGNTADRMRAVLSEHGFTDDDAILLVGSPLIIATGSLVAASFPEITMLRMLNWHASKKQYVPVILQL